MKVFCDTNLLVAAFAECHPHHNAALPIIERVIAGKDEGFVAAHTLAETYAVLTRLPGRHHVAPLVAWQVLSDNILNHFSVIALTAKEYADALKLASEMAVQGGMTYDAILLASAKKSRAERIYTFNVDHFRSLADPHLESKILSP